MAVLTQPLSGQEIDRLKALVLDGVQTLQEIQSLKENIKDACDAISEEFNIPAKLLKKAIDCSFKGNFSDHETELKDLETLLRTVNQLQ